MFWAEIWKISAFLYLSFQFLEVKFSIYLNRRVFVMYYKHYVQDSVNHCVPYFKGQFQLGKYQKSGNMQRWHHCSRRDSKSGTAGNYRPMSLTSVICKCLDKIVWSRILTRTFKLIVKFTIQIISFWTIMHIAVTWCLRRLISVYGKK